MKNPSTLMHIAHRRKEFGVEESRGGIDQLYRPVSISVLPDDVLLEIFSSLLTRPQDYIYMISKAPKEYEDAWHTLVHVCQRWRSIVFSSPRRLNLRLLCTNKRRIKEIPNIWPALPIFIHAYSKTSSMRGVSNLITALEHHDRMCKIDICGVSNSLLKLFGEIEKPFPELTHLNLWSRHEPAPAPALPDSFLGRSAPRLRWLFFDGIPFPALPKLLLSAQNLVLLQLWNIPPSGYISPESMVTCVAALTRLDRLGLGFGFPRSRADRESRPPSLLRPVVLPALTKLYFKGNSEYLEDIISLIDAPLLCDTVVGFFNQLIFDTPLLIHLISRTEHYKTPQSATIQFWDGYVRVIIDFPRIPPATSGGHINLSIVCGPSDWQLSSLAQVWSSALSPLLTLERLEVFDYRSHWQDDMEITQWLELLRPFISVKHLVLPTNLVGLLAPALQVIVEESLTEALPALERLSLREQQPSGPVKDSEAIRKFIAARQLFGRPIIFDQGNDRV